jgi:hypothetical protein
MPGPLPRRRGLAPLALLAPLAVAPLLAVCGCEPGDARFASRFASDFAHPGHTVSVLGVYKDGLMSTDAWETMRPRVSSALGSAACDAGYGDALIASNAPLATAIDDFTRSSGPTDDLVKQLAPAAKGDLVLVLTLSGQLPVEAKSHLGAPTPSTRMAGGGRRRTTNVPGAPSSPDGNELDFSAYLFSVPRHEPVGLVTMRYYGKTVDDALTKFTQRLGDLLPAARCDGWQWPAGIDPDAIRRSIDP